MVELIKTYEAVYSNYTPDDPMNCGRFQGLVGAWEVWDVVLHFHRVTFDLSGIKALDQMKEKGWIK